MRDAIAKYLDGDLADLHTGTPPVKRALPSEAFQLTPPYMAWSGDLRCEAKRLYAQALACAFVCAQHWPKAPGVRESYAGLLALAPHFGLGGTVGQG